MHVINIDDESTGIVRYSICKGRRKIMSMLGSQQVRVSSFNYAFKIPVIPSVL